MSYYSPNMSPFNGHLVLEDPPITFGDQGILCNSTWSGCGSWHPISKYTCPKASMYHRSRRLASSCQGSDGFHDVSLWYIVALQCSLQLNFEGLCVHVSVWYILGP